MDNNDIKARLRKLQPMWRISRPSRPGEQGRDMVAESFGMAVFDDDGTCTPVWCSMADVMEEPVEWLWKDHFPLGMVSLIVGEQGSGKTYVGLDMIARVTRGAEWPDGSGTAPLGKAILLSAEDHPRKVLKRRLRIAEADCGHVKLFQGVEERNQATNEHKIVMFDAGRNLIALDLLLLANNPCPLVIIDPITAYMGDADQNSNAEVRAALGGLVALAARHNTAIVAISHMNKSKGMKTLHRTLGSTAFSAMARCIWQVDQPEGVRKQSAFTWQKSNISPKVPGRYFTVQDDRIVWGEACSRSANAVSQDGLRRRNSSARDAACAWLAGILKDGPLLRADVLRAAEAAGHAGRTVLRAAKRLGVSMQAVKNHNGVRWALSAENNQK